MLLYNALVISLLLGYRFLIKSIGYTGNVSLLNGPLLLEIYVRQPERRFGVLPEEAGDGRDVVFETSRLHGRHLRGGT